MSTADTAPEGPRQRGGKGPGAQKPGGQKKIRAVPVPPPAPPTRAERRHYGVIFAFVLLVLAPILLSGFYLFTRAQDQYASVVGFTVRSEEATSASDLLGGLSTLGTSTSKDTDVLHEFLQSQILVEQIDARLDLRTLYARHHATDPVLSFNPEGSIEDLVDFWNRMVRISYDAATGLIEVTVLAFAPEDARTIATALVEESTNMINALSEQAREDALRYAVEDLDTAFLQLQEARLAVTTFRSRTQIVDPEADIQGQIGLVTNLQSKLADALVDQDLLRQTASPDDPRLASGALLIQVIRDRIEAERRRFGGGGSENAEEDYATLLAEFERLALDREFAEASYAAARSAYETAKAEAARQSRYLALHINPTLAQTSQYPQRIMILGLTALFSFIAWAIGTLIYYSARDRY